MWAHVGHTVCCGILCCEPCGTGDGRAVSHFVADVRVDWTCTDRESR